MKNTKAAVIGIVVGTIIGAGAFTYVMKHPDLNNIRAIESSWLSPQEKTSSIHRLVRLGCDQRFRKAFKPGVSVVQTGNMDEITEQAEAYQYLNDVAILYGTEGFKGAYICTYYKDGKDPVVNVNMEAGVRKLLK
ncbi:putative portal protein [Salmonella phage 19]|nr:putative portal protein [Salmonella phage 19]